MSTTTAVDIGADFRELRDQLNAAFYEREEVIEATLLAILAGEHLFVLGPPGSAKTNMTDTIAGVFSGASYFKCAMSKNRPAEAVLGPYDLIELRTNGHLYRRDKGFLTTADIAQIDEIGKMSPIIGHDMLSILNEREKHEVNGGRSAHSIPLSTAICNSNEVPTDVSDDAAALWDRILFRTYVDYIKSDKNFVALLSGAAPEVTKKIDWDDVRMAIATEVPQVKIPTGTLEAVNKLRHKLEAEGIVVSTRRWKKSMKALQAKAFLEGRDEVYEEDLTALRFTLWETLLQLETVVKLTGSASNPFVGPLMEQGRMLSEIQQGITSRKDLSTGELTDYAAEVNPKIQEVKAKLEALYVEANGRPIPRLESVVLQLRETITMLYCVGFKMDEDTARSVADSKMPKFEGPK